MEELNDELVDKLSLTPKQLEATKEVYKAMKKAGRLGVHFWDDYGTLTAYNSKKISVPHMEPGLSRADKAGEQYFPAECGTKGSEVLYYEPLNNFSAGNADDPYWGKIL